MNRENKRKTFEKGITMNHACNDTFTCKVCGRVCTAKCRERPPQPLPQLPVQRFMWTKNPATAHSDCSGIMEAGGRLSTQRRRVNHHPPLQTLRKLNSTGWRQTTTP